MDHAPDPERARSFGAVAAAYERFRPGYPDELVDLLTSYAGGPIRTALEIGAGTGKATRVLAARGIAVLASDPDPAMLAELVRHVPASVRTVRATLEDLPPTDPVDLVVAAASLHWTEPVGRWERIAARLRPGGVVAAFGRRTELADPGLRVAERAARARWLPDDDIPVAGIRDPSGMRWPGTELLTAEAFTDVRQETLPERIVLRAEAYAGLLSTVSAYLVLPDEDRRRVLEAVLGALPPVVELTADVDVHLARRT